MTEHIHPGDKADALRWAIKEIRFRAPQGGYGDQIDRNRLHILDQLAREAELEARK